MDKLNQHLRKFGLLWTAFLILLSFGKSVNNEYSLDDELVTPYNNALVQKGWDGLGEILTSPYSQANGQSFGYRPVTKLSYAIEFALFGLNPALSHAINLLLYFVLIWLVSYWYSMVFSKSVEYIKWIFLFVFAIHPLHSEVVLSLKNREEIFAGIFIFLSFISFLKYVSTKFWGYLIAGFLAFILGYLSKATVIPFVFIMPFTLWYFSSASIKKSLLLMFSLAFVGYLNGILPQIWLNLQLDRPFDYIENPLQYSPILQRIPTSCYLFGAYVAKMFWPVPLLSYYGINYINPTQWFDIKTILGMAAALGALVFIWRGKKHKVLVYSVVWYISSISVFLNLVTVAPGIFAERFAFMSLLAFALFVSAGVELLSKSKIKPKMVGLGLIICLVLMAFINNKRADEWRNMEQLLSADIAKAPESVKLTNMYAEYMHMRTKSIINADEKKKYIEISAKNYLKAIELYPQNVGAYMNLGLLCLEVGQNENALINIRKSIAKGNKTAEAFYNLGAALEICGKPILAKEAYLKSLALNKNFLLSEERLKMLEN